MSGASTGGSLLCGGGSEVNIETESDGRFRVILTDAAVRARQDQAIDQSVEVIRRRIDETGTLEPIIQRLAELAPPHARRFNDTRMLALGAIAFGDPVGSISDLREAVAHHGASRGVESRYS